MLELFHQDIATLFLNTATKVDTPFVIKLGRVKHNFMNALPLVRLSSQTASTTEKQDP